MKVLWFLALWLEALCLSKRDAKKAGLGTASFVDASAQKEGPRGDV